MKESDFQGSVINELKRLIGDDGLVIKLDTRQGIPDILVLYKGKWAMFECKRSKDASHQPNQDYYVRKMDRLSFSRFIFPENKEDVLNEFCEAFGLTR